MANSWEAVDGSVRKDTLQRSNFSNKPIERCICNIHVEDVAVYPMLTNNWKEQYPTEILGDIVEKTITIGDANTEIDRKIERAVQMMMIGEKSLVTINAHATSKPIDIGQVAVIKFQITLLNFQPHIPIWKWTPQEKYDIASMYKEDGVQLFKDCRYVDAFYKFAKACKILITLEPVSDLELDRNLETKINDLRLTLYNNMAGCHLNRNNFEHVISLCNKILQKDQNNVKALYRRGIACGGLKDIEKAFSDFKTVIELEPHNAAAKKQFLIYNEKVQEANKKCNDMVRRMFKV